MKTLKLFAIILMVLGVMLYVLGFVSNIQHWPDLLRGKISGQIITIIGVVLYIIYLFANQRNRK